MKQAKNVYESALLHELTTDRGIQAICNAIGEKYVTESTAWCWYEQGRTEKEIIKLLRKIGYEIPKEIIGSDRVFGA